jgi:hypothetical protein
LVQARTLPHQSVIDVNELERERKREEKQAKSSVLQLHQARKLHTCIASLKFEMCAFSLQSQYDFFSRNNPIERVIAKRSPYELDKQRSNRNNNFRQATMLITSFSANFLKAHFVPPPPRRTSAITGRRSDDQAPQHQVRTPAEEESQHQHDDPQEAREPGPHDATLAIAYAAEERAAVSDEGEDGPEDDDERQGLGQEPVPLPHLVDRRGL